MSGTTSLTVGGGSAVLSVSGNDYVATHASMFASMAMQLASAANSFYTAPAGSTLFVIPNDMGDVVINGTTGSTATIVAGDGTTLDYTPGGSTNAMIVAGNGNDTVLAGAGNDTIALGAGNNNIQLGAGNSIVYSQGTDSIVSGSGNDTIDLAGNGSTVDGGYAPFGQSGGTMMVDDTQGSGDFIFAAAAGSTVKGSDVGTTTVVAFGNITVDGGTATDNVYAGNGAVINLTSAASNNILVANDGRKANGDYVYLNGASASGGNQLWAGSGNATLVGGTGADTLVAGAGAVTMTGGRGSNAFDFFNISGSNDGNATITDFTASYGDKMVLWNYTAANVQDALNSAKQVGTSTTFGLGDGTTITLQNFAKTNLVATDFTTVKL